jgi:RNA polymerase sigma-70 factor (ECF subfamily)
MNLARKKEPKAGSFLPLDGCGRREFACATRFWKGKCCKKRPPAGYMLMAELDSGTPTRASLLLRLRNPRDAEAWRTFVDVYGPLVYGHCRRRGVEHNDAEDLMQKIFAQVMQSIRAFDYQPNLGRFRDWLGTIVRNDIGRFFRQRGREVARSASAEADPLQQVAGRGEDTSWNEEFQAHVLRVALARSQPHFEADTWRAFELVWLEHQSAADVARQLNRPIDFVYVAKSRVLKQLWKEVQELAEDAPLASTLSRSTD